MLSYGNDKKIKSFLGVPDQNENFKAGERDQNFFKETDGKYIYN